VLLSYRHHGNDAEATGVSDAAAEASSSTSAEEDRVPRGRQELERGEIKPLRAVLIYIG